MKKEAKEKPPEPSPDVGTYNPIRYNDIGARETIALVHSSSKKTLGRKMSQVSLARDTSPQQRRSSFDRLKRRSVDSGKGRNSSTYLNES